MVSCRAPPSLVPKRKKKCLFLNLVYVPIAMLRMRHFFCTFNAVETCSLFLKQINARLNAVEMKLLSLKSLNIYVQITPSNI